MRDFIGRISLSFVRQSYARLTALGFSGTVSNSFPLVKITNDQAPVGDIFINAMRFSIGDSHSMFSASIESGLVRAACAYVVFALLSLSANAQQQPAQPVQEKPGAEKAVEPESKQPEANKRVEMNLLGKTDAASGES